MLKSEGALFEMKKRYSNALLPNVNIVDMSDEMANGNTTTFSSELAKAINTNLENNEQTILLLTEEVTIHI